MLFQRGQTKRKSECKDCDEEKEILQKQWNVFVSQPFNEAIQNHYPNLNDLC